MSILIKTNNPEAFLKDFKKKIDDKLVKTWSYDQDGDFTHTPDQWKNKAWLRTSIKGGSLSVGILGPQGEKLSSLVYAVYHGRFIESILFHCDSLFSEATASAFPTSEDYI